jgi:hypothetical protein
MFSTLDHVFLPLAHSSSLAKTIFQKKIDLVVRSHIFAEMGDVMYLRGVGIHPTQVEAKREALNNILSTLQVSIS